MRLISLVALAACLLAACGGGEAAPSPTATPPPTARPARSPTPAPSPTASAAPTPAPTPEPTASGATIDVGGSFPRQGGFLMVRLLHPPPGTAVATAYFTGVGYAMLPEGDRWYTFIGLPTWFTIGGYPVEVWSGETLLASGWLDVTEGAFDFLSIEIPPGPADLLTDTARIEEERLRVDSVLAVVTPERYWSGAWIAPATGDITSNFGEHRSINGGAYFPHSGKDIANEEGTPVYAPASGVVAMAETLFLYGNSIIIDHGVGVLSGYGHLSAMNVTAGQWVNKGDLIGQMGTTGLSSGPHLHWEAVVRGARVDPTLWTLAAVDP